MGKVSLKTRLERLSEKLFDQGVAINKTGIAGVTILAAAFLIGLNIWASHHRYSIVTGDEVAYEVDRKTGETWILYGDRKVPQPVKGLHQDQDQQEGELPYGAASMITGYAGLSYESFSGKLYNGSDWVVTEVIMNLSAKEEDGTVRWSRDFSEAVTIRPLTTESFSITVAGGEGIKEAPWTIKRVFGYKDPKWPPPGRRFTRFLEETQPSQRRGRELDFSAVDSLSSTMHDDTLDEPPDSE